MNKILICDDEPDIVSALKIYLESEGFSVISATNGKEAVITTPSDSVSWGSASYTAAGVTVGVTVNGVYYSHFYAD